MVLIASVDVSRVLPFSAPKEYYLVYVFLVPENDALLPSFSGKVVKTLLIKGNPRLEYVFESSEVKPKPIRCSPLGYLVRGKQIYLWKRVKSGSNGEASSSFSGINVSSGGLKASDSDGIVGVTGGREYFFILGFDETVKHLVFEAFMNIDGVIAYNTRWKLTRIEVNCYPLPSMKPLVKLDGVDSVKVEFRSPVNIVDPYKPSRFRRFLPLAGFLLSYNIGEIARMDRDKREYWDLINIVSAVLQETHNLWDTVKRVYYLYDGKAIPGLTGYIKYYVAWETLEKNPNLKLLVENVLSHAIIMGVGAGRANGFGHVTVKLEKTSLERGHDKS